MSSQYSTNLRTELIGSGDQAGNWGNTTNSTLGSIIEQAIAGVSGGPYIGGTYPAVNFPTDADITLTANNGSVDQSRSAVLVITSSVSLTATRNVVAPASASKIYIIKNSTTGGQSIQIKYATGTGVTITNGNSAIVYGDGTNFYFAETLVANATNAVTAATANALNTGNAYQGTTFTATTQFAGPGTGLTGTAAGLSIGGNAASATSAGSASTAGSATNATNLVSGGTIASNVTATTQAVNDNSTKVATTAYVATALSTSIKGLGYGGETWHNVAGSRSTGTNYTNSYAYPIMVSYTQNGNNGTTATIVVGGVTVATEYISSGTQGANSQLTAIVPPGGVYQCTGSGISYWAELY
jgi:hypothetical protein